MVTNNQSFLGRSSNEYGTAISLHRCVGCGEVFTVCPAVEEERIDAGEWDACMAVSCATYDPQRDADRFFGEGTDAFRLKRADA